VRGRERDLLGHGRPYTRLREREREREKEMERERERDMERERETERDLVGHGGPCARWPSPLPLLLSGMTLLVPVPVEI
jgi:hypothetical protein